MIRRRAMLAALAALAACEKKQDDEGKSPPAAAPPQGKWREIAFSPSAHYDEPELAAVRIEPKAPVLVALHGRGEAGRGLAAGARGWRDEYDLDRAYARCQDPPLRQADFHGFVTEERLAELNASLKKHPFEGLTVACPYAPALQDRSADGAAPFGRFITEMLLPRVGEVVGSAQKGREHAGIDGVSMGGRLALLVGLTHSEDFGAVGALQPAIGEREAEALADLAASAEPRPKIRLVSSEGDPFLGAVRALSKQLDRREIDHQLVVTPGPHDYIYNKGPGSYEMLLWHERVLRGHPPP